MNKGQILTPPRDRASRSSAASAEDGQRDAEKHLLSYIPASLVQRVVADPIEPATPWKESFLGAVAFVDVSGFTALSEKLKSEVGRRGAELLNQYMNSYFDQLIQVVCESGGDVIKFAGDALQVVWRHPPAPDELLPISSAYADGAGEQRSTYGDTAGDRKIRAGPAAASAATNMCAHNPTALGELLIRAVRCCMQLLNELNDFSPVDGVHLTLHVGIGVGPMSAFCVGGEGGRWEYFVAGEPIEQMAVATDLAKAGQLVLSPHARALLTRFEKLGKPTAVRGGARSSRGSDEPPNRNTWLLRRVRASTESAPHMSADEMEVDLGVHAAELLRAGAPIGDGGLLIARVAGGRSSNHARLSAAARYSIHSAASKRDAEPRLLFGRPAAGKTGSGKQSVRQTVAGLTAVSSIRSAASDVHDAIQEEPHRSAGLFRRKMRRANPPLPPLAGGGVGRRSLHMPALSQATLFMHHLGGARALPRRSEARVSEGEGAASGVAGCSGQANGITVGPEALRVLRCFVPALIDERLAAGQAGLWVSEHRVITTVFLKLLGLGRKPCQPATLGSTHAAVRAVQEAFSSRGGAVLRLITDDKGTRFLVAFGLPGQQDGDEVSRAVMAAVEATIRLKGIQAPVFDSAGGDDPPGKGGLGEGGGSRKEGGGDGRGSRPAPTLRCAIGVTTGRAFCGEAGCSIRREYTLMGSSVNMAARLMQAAEKMGHSILVDEETSSATPPTACTYVSLPAILVKGRDEPLPIFAPIEARARTLELATLLDRRRVRPNSSTDEGGLRGSMGEASTAGSRASAASAVELLAAGARRGNQVASVYTYGSGGRGPRVAVTATIGRDRERMAIKNALLQVQGGRGGALVLLGEAGMGKTQMTQVLSHLHDESFPVIRISGTFQREAGELSCFRPLFRRLLCDATIRELGRLSDKLYPLSARGGKPSSGKLSAGGSKPSSGKLPSSPGKSNRRLPALFRSEASGSKSHGFRPERQAANPDSSVLRSLDSSEGSHGGGATKAEKSVSISLPPSPPGSPPPPSPRWRSASPSQPRSPPGLLPPAPAHQPASAPHARTRTAAPIHRKPPALPPGAASRSLSAAKAPLAAPPPAPPRPPPAQEVAQPARELQAAVSVSVCATDSGPRQPVPPSRMSSVSSDLAEDTWLSSQPSEQKSSISTELPRVQWDHTPSPLRWVQIPATANDVVSPLPEPSRESTSFAISVNQGGSNSSVGSQRSLKSASFASDAASSSEPSRKTAANGRYDPPATTESQNPRRRSTSGESVGATAPETIAGMHEDQISLNAKGAPSASTKTERIKSWGRSIEGRRYSAAVAPEPVSPYGSASNGATVERRSTSVERRLSSAELRSASRARASFARKSERRTPEQQAHPAKLMARMRWRTANLAIQAWTLPLRTVTLRNLSIRPSADAKLLSDRTVISLSPLLTPVLPTPLNANSATHKLSGAARHAATLRVMSQVLQLKLGGAPAALVIADADYMDASSWALLAKLLRDMPDLLIVLELQPNTPRPAGAQAVLASEQSSIIRLSGLREDEIVTLVERILGEGSVPPRLAGLIHRRCDGNPLYAMELARSLLQEGKIRLSAAGEYVLSVSELDISLPTTIEGLITSRIDRLPMEQQMWLKLSSVLGQNFTVAAVHELSRSLPVLAGPNAARSAMNKAIAGLIAVGMLRATPMSTKGDYEHAHGAVHAAAYSLLPAELKATLHTAAARYYDEFIVAARFDAQRKAEAARAASSPFRSGWSGMRDRIRDNGASEGKDTLRALGNAAVRDIEGWTRVAVRSLERNLASLSGQKLIALGEMELARKARHHWVRAAEEGGGAYVVQNAVRHLTTAVDAELATQSDGALTGGFLYTSSGHFGRAFMSVRDGSDASVQDRLGLQQSSSVRSESLRSTSNESVRFDSSSSLGFRQSASNICSRLGAEASTSGINTHATPSLAAKAPLQDHVAIPTHFADADGVVATSNALEMCVVMVKLLTTIHAQQVLLGPAHRRLGQAMLQLGRLDEAREELHAALFSLGQGRIPPLGSLAMQRKLLVEELFRMVDAWTRPRPPMLAVKLEGTIDMMRLEIAQTYLLCATLEQAQAPQVARLRALQALWYAMRLPCLHPILPYSHELLANLARRGGQKRFAGRLLKTANSIATGLRHTSAAVSHKPRGHTMQMTR